MNFNVNRIVPDKDFSISGTSYIGVPRSNTAMFITKKVEHLLVALQTVSKCLIFAENGIVVADELLNRHAFSFSSNPQLAYARFANQFEQERFKEEKTLSFNLMPGGYYVSEDCVVPDDAYIEPGCVIGPDVIIGKKARVLANSVIRRATIGDNFYANENAVVGANGFTMAEDEDGNKIRIPTLGRVIIGNNVEIGAHDNISCGSGGNTVLEDNVKVDALVHIGHDVHLKRNVELTAGTVLGGFGNIGENVFIGLNSTVKNRTEVGDSCHIDMGSVVVRSIDKELRVFGNPARKVIVPNK